MQFFWLFQLLMELISDGIKFYNLIILVQKELKNPVKNRLLAGIKSGGVR
jgi:hypothetical protein